MMDLAGPQLEVLSEAFRHAFPTRPRLEQMLKFKLDRNLNDISLATNMRDIVFDLIQTAAADGWMQDLIFAARIANPANDKLLAFVQSLFAARAANPGNDKLLAFVQSLGLASTAMSPTALQQMIQPKAPLLDPNVWRQRLFDVENQVCSIEIRCQHQGTGFLVGVDAVITNYHVMVDVIEGRIKPSEVHLRFDYKRLADGETINSGALFSLADQWLIHSSPPSQADLVATAGDPQPNELDYALLRAKGDPGNQPAPGSTGPDAAPRGFIAAPASEFAYALDKPLLIMQYPKGHPLKLAIDMAANMRLNGNGTRVHYRTNTDHGSSGSPCLSIEWDLVALHHSGDPEQKFLYNQGIPFMRIVDNLKTALHSETLEGILGSP